jgi:hypothetical protein
MTTTITYPLRFAISLSPSAGAVYTGNEGHLTVQTLEGWLITGELHQQHVCEEFQEYEDCSWYLAAHKIPEDTGWIPEPLALVPDEGWL